MASRMSNILAAGIVTGPEDQRLGGLEWLRISLGFRIWDFRGVGFSGLRV